MSPVTLPAGWPEGKPLAVSVSVMLEGWTDDSAPGVGPMGNVLRAGVLDLQARSWAEYGPRVGAWRILDILAETGVRAVFYVSGVLAERYPALMRAIADAGHVVAGHSWGQNIIPATQTPADEARDLERCVTVLTETTGAAPRGWLSPRCTPSRDTTALLAERGFGWHADFFDSDLPRVEPTRSGPIVAVPFTMEVNDMPLSVRYGQEPDAFPRLLEKIVAGWPRLGSRPGCIDVTVHAHVFGRPAGALAFIEALDVAKRYAEWAWLTDHAALAALWRNV
jgi:peptidoglycan/xylan/chitin deacetylase (PgdA/CDA1 family)